MGSAQQAAYESLVRELLRWPGLRERPEGDTPFGRTCARDSLRLNGARFASFHLDENRVLHVAFPVPASLAGAIPEATRVGSDRLEARFNLGSKAQVARSRLVAALLYEARTGRSPPARA